MEFDFGAAEGGLTGALVIITSIAKWIQGKMAEQIEQLKKQLEEQNKEQDKHLDEYKIIVEEKMRKLKRAVKKDKLNRLEEKIDQLLSREGIG
jgi:hypothetical protein